MIGTKGIVPFSRAVGDIARSVGLSEEDRPPPVNFSGRRACFQVSDRSVPEIIDGTKSTKADPAPRPAAATQPHGEE